VPTARLVDELWSERPPQTAVKSVQVFVSQLRRLLPQGLIATRTRGYVLEVDPDAVDLLRFERLVEEARTAAPPEQAAALWREALRLWRGPALAEFGAEPFFRAEAARLEELRLSAVEARLEADLALGRHSELVDSPPSSGCWSRGDSRPARPRAGGGRGLDLPLRPEGCRARMPARG
jgi:DNA-binding SARP family transcriptional activator